MGQLRGPWLCHPHPTVSGVASPQRAWGHSMRSGSLPSLLTSTKVSKALLRAQRDPPSPRGGRAPRQSAPGQRAPAASRKCPHGRGSGAGGEGNGWWGRGRPLWVLRFPGQSRRAQLSGLTRWPRPSARRQKGPRLPICLESRARGVGSTAPGQPRPDFKDCQPIEMARIMANQGRRQLSHHWSCIRGASSSTWVRRDTQPCPRTRGHF